MSEQIEAAYRQALAEAKAAWKGDQFGEDPPPALMAAAKVCGLDLDKLWDAVEGERGWEPHNDGYEDQVLAIAEKEAGLLCPRGVKRCGGDCAWACAACGFRNSHEALCFRCGTARNARR